MSVRKHPRREGWWIIDYYPDGRGGKRERIPFSGTYEDALQMEHELLEARSAPPVVPLGLPPTITKLAPEYLLYAGNHLSAGTVADVKMVLELRILPHFGHYRPNQLAPVLVEEFKAKRLEDGVKKRTINKELAYFSGMLKWAKKQGKISPLHFLIEGFPAKQTKAPTPRVPEREQIEAMLAKMKGEQKWLAALMFQCGLRKSEAFGLCGGDVAQGGKLLIIKGKGDKERVVPVPPELRAELIKRAEKAGPAGLLFISKRTGKAFGHIRKSIATAAKKAGIHGGMKHHLLRHGYGTHAIASGVPQRIVQSSMGHSDPRTTDMYTHLAGNHLLNAFTPFAGEEKADDPGFCDGSGI